MYVSAARSLKAIISHVIDLINMCEVAAHENHSPANSKECLSMQGYTTHVAFIVWIQYLSMVMKVHHLGSCELEERTS